MISINTNTTLKFNAAKHGSVDDAVRAFTKAEAVLSKKLITKITQGTFALPSGMMLRVDALDKECTKFTADDLDICTYLNVALRLDDSQLADLLGMDTACREVVQEYEALMGRMSLEFIRAQFAEPEAEPQHVYWDLFDTLEGIKEPVLRLRVLESVAFTSGGMALAKASSYVFEVRKLMEENVPLQEIASAIRTEEWHRTVQGFRAPLTDLSHLLSFRTRVIDAAHVAAAAIGKKARIKSLDDMIKDEEVRSLKGDQIVNLKLIAEMTCDNPEDVEDVHKSLVDSQNAQARHWVATRKMMAPATTWVIEQAQALWESGNFFELDEETRQRLVVHATNAVDRATSDLAISRITPIAFALILNEARALKRELAAN